MRKLIATAIAGVVMLTLSSCADDADVVSDNLSKAADNFEVQRRVVFYNGITDTYVLEVVGYCSVLDGDRLAVVCKVGDGEYVKHFLKTSDNVTWFAEQLEASNVSASHYRVTFKPQTILPDVDARVDTDDLPESQ